MSTIELIEPEASTEPQDIAEIRDGAAVVKLNRTEAGLAQLKTDLAGKVYDPTTVKGDREARNDRLRCVSLRTGVEAMRKTLKAPALKFGQLIDSEAKRITAAVEALEAPIDAAIKADEARREEERQAKARAEAARLAGLRDAAAAALGKWIARCQADGITSERIAAGIDMLADLPANPEWAEVNDFWQSTKAQTLATMRGLLDAAQRREEAAIQRQQAEELAKLRAELEAQAQALRDQAAELERQKQAAAKREADALAEQQRQAEAKLAAELQAVIDAAKSMETAIAAAAAPAKELTEGQDTQQVLKATPATADATDRDAPANASPRVGAMGAGQAADAAPAGVVPAIHMTDEACADMVAKALRRAWSLGQTYWQQADSESISQNKRADKTQAIFAALVDETRAALVTHLQRQGKPA